jgi:coatomer protein complex subunit epsilon
LGRLIAYERLFPERTLTTISIFYVTSLLTSELFSIENAFYSGQYDKVIAADLTKLQGATKRRAQVLQLRSQIYSGKATSVIKTLQNADELDLQGVRAYAEYVSDAAKSNSVQALEKLLESAKDNATIKYLAGLVLANEGREADALKALDAPTTLECLSLAAQIHLQQNRIDAAAALIADGKEWAQDNVVFNISEAWTNLRQGPDRAQAAYYIFEELNSHPNARALNGMAVAQLVLGQYPEADASLGEALQRDPQNPEALANAISAAIILGKDYAELEATLEHSHKDHSSLVDLQEKSKLFDKVAAKYSVGA